MSQIQLKLHVLLDLTQCLAMANSSSPESRLDRLEALAETTLLAIQQESQQIAELRNTVTRQGEDIRQQNSGLRDGISDVVAMISDLAEQQAQTDFRIEALRQQQQETDQRFNNVLADARADRQRAEESIQAFTQQAEADRQRAEQNDARRDEEHQAFVESMQAFRQQAEADRQQAEADRRQTEADRRQANEERDRNEREHQAFRESFQSMLAEITRIWQRLAG